MIPETIFFLFVINSFPLFVVLLLLKKLRDQTTDALIERRRELIRSLENVIYQKKIFFYLNVLLDMFVRLLDMCVNLCCWILPNVAVL